MEQEQEGRLGQGARDLSSPAPRSAGDPGEAAQSSSPVAALGPWLLLFPLVFLALALVWIAGRRDPTPRAPRAPERDGVAVAGWVGEVELGGARLVARLAPLHVAPQRQAFERQVLAARYGLGEGEPFQLTLTLGATGTAAAEVDLEALSVQDRGGVRLVPLSAEQRLSGQPADPLRALLAPPEGGLAPGRGVHLMLWGRIPGPDARLRGAARVEGATAPFEVPLEARSLALGSAEGVLARGESPPVPRARPAPREPGSGSPRGDAREDSAPRDVPRAEAPLGAQDESLTGVDDEDR